MKRRNGAVGYVAVGGALVVLAISLGCGGEVSGSSTSGDGDGGSGSGSSVGGATTGGAVTGMGGFRASGGSISTGGFGAESGGASAGGASTAGGVPASCREVLAKNPGTPSGTYPIDPDGVGGNASLFANCEMDVSAGGWTKLTAAVAAYLPPGNREYLYLSRLGTYYVSPCSPLVWSWAFGSGQQLTGAYEYFDGTNTGSINCVGSSELPTWGVGCSSGPGVTAKVLPIYNSSASTGESTICQDIPDAFLGGACVEAVAILTREGCAP